MGKEITTITNRSVGTADDKGNRLNRIADRLKARLCKINGTAREKQATWYRHFSLNRTGPIS